MTTLGKNPAPGLDPRTRLLHALAPLSTERRLEALDYWAERAAIREHLGEARRESAELDAAAETCAEFGVPWRAR